MHATLKSPGTVNWLILVTGMPPHCCQPRAGTTDATILSITQASSSFPRQGKTLHSPQDGTVPQATLNSFRRQD